MLPILFILAAVAFFVYKYFADQLEYWKQKGIPGPEPELFLGNIRQLFMYHEPRSLVLRDWVKKYGKVYGIHEGTRKMLVVADLDMLNEILVKKFDHFYARAPFYIQRMQAGPKTHLVEARGGQWKRLRALGSFAFTNKALKNIRQTIEQSALQVCDGLKKEKGEVNVLHFYQEYTLDVICKVALGMKDAKMFNNKYLQVCKEIFMRPLWHPITVIPCIFPAISDYYVTALETVGRFLRIPFVLLMEDLSEAVALRKLQRDRGAPSSGDFVDIFLDAEVEDTSEMQFGENSDTSRKLHFEEVVSQCMVFLLAGFETTSNSLAYVSHFLANHPEVQEKMREEIEAVCPDDEIDYDSLQELKYTECVIKESLRHYPLASFVVNRECIKHCEIGGYKIEKGDMIQTETWSMHMDKEIWGEDAEEFRPDRWLEETDRARVAFQAFGEGPRMCIGMRLAYLEEKIMLAHLLKQFVIEKSEHTNPIKLVGAITVAPETLLVKLTPRTK